MTLRIGFLTVCLNELSGYDDAEVLKIVYKNKFILNWFSLR